MKCLKCILFSAAKIIWFEIPFYIIFSFLFLHHSQHEQYSMSNVRKAIHIQSKFYVRKSYISHSKVRRMSPYFILLNIDVNFNTIFFCTTLYNKYFTRHIQYMILPTSHCFFIPMVIFINLGI